MLTPQFWVITLVVAIGRMGIEMFNPMLPSLAHYFFDGCVPVEFVITIYLIGFTVAQFVGGICSDYMGRKKVWLYGIVLYLGGTLLCFWDVHWSALLVSRFLMGFGIGIGPSVGRAILSDQYPTATFINFVAALSNVLVISSMISPVLSGWLVSMGSWQYNLFFLALLGVLSFIGSLFFLKETRDISKHASYSRLHLMDSTKSLLKDRLFVGATILSGISFGIMMGFGQVASITVIEQMDYSPTMFGWIMSFLALGYLLGGFIAKKVSPRFTHQQILHASFVGMAGIALVATILLYFHLNIVSYIAPIFLIFALGRVVVPVCGALSVSGKSQSGLASSFFGLGYLGVSSLLSFVFAVFLRGNPVGLYLTFMILGLIGVVTVRWAYQNKESRV